MNPLPSFAVGVAVILGMLYGAFWYGGHTEGQARDLIAAEERIASQAVIADVKEQNAIIKTKLKEQKDEANNVVNHLLEHPVSRVRIIAPVPSSSKPITNASTCDERTRAILAAAGDDMDKTRQEVRVLVGVAERELNELRAQSICE